MNIRNISFLSLLILMAFCSSVSLAAESIDVRKVDISEYPQVDLSLILETELELDGFTITQDSESIDDVVAIKVSEKPMSVVMLIDLSGSMKGEPIFEAKKAAKQFAEQVGAADRIAVVSFSSEVIVVNRFTANKAEVAVSIDSLAVKGETRLHDAIAMAFELIAAESSERKAIVILSDGGDTRSTRSGEEVTDLASSAGVPVYAIALTSPELDTQVLQETARLTEGRLITDVRPETLADAYARLAAEFKSEYRLSFESIVHSGSSKVSITAELGGDDLATQVEVVPPEGYEAAVVAVTPADQEGLFPTIASPIWLAVSAALGFAAVVLFVSAVGWRPATNTLSDTMEYYEELKTNEGRLANTSSLAGTYAGLLGITSRLAGKRGFTDVFSVKLQQAGLKVKPHEYMIIHLSAVVVVSLISLVAFRSLMTSMVVILLAAAAPMMILSLLAQRRLKKLDEQLPDTLSGMSGFLKAGYGVSQAIESAGQESPDPIGAELKRVAGQTSFGTPLEEALFSMAERVSSKQFDWAVTAIAINKETGGNLSAIIDQVAAGMRQRQSFNRQIKSFAAEGKISASILLLLPIVMSALLFIINPGYMSLLFTTSSGRLMMFTGIGMMILGTLWMRKIIKIEY